MYKKIISLALILSLVIVAGLLPIVVPVTVASTGLLENGATIALWHDGGLAVKNNGELFMWGGDNKVPVKVADGVLKIFTVGGFVVAEMTNGSLTIFRIQGRELRLERTESDVAKVFYIEEYGNRLLVMKSDNSIWAHVTNNGIHEPRIWGYGPAIAAYETTSYKAVIRPDGTLWAWGDLGAIGRTEEPMKVLNDVVQIPRFGGVLKKDGTIWHWRQAIPEMNNNYTDIDRVLRIGNIGDIHYIKKDGSYWYRGFQIATDVKHAIPLNNPTFSSAPSSGAYITINGDLWVWGRNNVGQQGVGAEHWTVSYNERVKVMSKVADVVVARGSILNDTDYTLALTNDGSLWGWGLNTKHQLGIGNSLNAFAPVKIMDGVKLPATPDPTPGPLTTDPLDSASPWARPEIQSAQNKGLVTPELLVGNYQSPITRGEFVRLAMNYLRVTLKMTNAQLVANYATHPSRTFTDTTDADLIAAGKLGITSGTGGAEPNRVFGDGLFDREMAAFMLRRVHIIVTGNSETVPDQGYNDMNRVRWHPTAVNYVIHHRIMTGTNPTAGIFSPLNNFTREQSIATFDRMPTEASPQTSVAPVTLRDGLYMPVREDVWSEISVRGTRMNYGDISGTITYSGGIGIFTSVFNSFEFRAAGDSIFIMMDMWDGNDVVSTEVEFAWWSN